MKTIFLAHHSQRQSKSMACNVPVLLLAFNRPGHTQQVMERIRLAEPPRLYAHCDGPRLSHPSDQQNVIDVRQIIEGQRSDKHLELRTFFRDSNAGLKKGVHEAISWFFENEEFGIILEDDCLPDPTVFQFCSELLLKYRNDPQIMHIGCSNLAEAKCSEYPGSYLFSKFSFIWGWASWRRAWQHMDINFQGLKEFEYQKRMEQILADRQAQTYMLDKFNSTKNGKLNTWDYAWFFSILENNGLCIVPKVNLVQNTGIGSADATNTRKQNSEAQISAKTMRFPLIHPEHFSIDSGMEETFFYTTQKSKLRLRLWAFLHAVGLR